MTDPMNAFTHLHIYALTSHKRQPTKEYVRNYQQNMQNKPNFPQAMMSATSLLTKDYENKSNPTLGENKANSKPNKPNLPEAGMRINVYYTRNYDNNLPMTPCQNKANSNPISEKLKMNVRTIIAKDYEDQPLRRLR